jgi:hypothetical protein
MNSAAYIFLSERASNFMLETTQVRLLRSGVKIAVYIARVHIQRIALVYEITQLVRWGNTRAAVPQIDTHHRVRFAGCRANLPFILPIIKSSEQSDAIPGIQYSCCVLRLEVTSAVVAAQCAFYRIE